jgi:hypothetical protein
MRTVTVYKLVFVNYGTRLSLAQASLPFKYALQYPVGEWVEPPSGLLLVFDTLAHAEHYLDEIFPGSKHVELWSAQATGKQRVDYVLHLDNFTNANGYSASQFWARHAQPILRTYQDAPHYCIRTPAGTVGVKRLRLVEQIWP